MENLNIIDQFLQTFTRYIDSGFGLVNGDVVGLSSVLIAIDVTLAGLFWALDPDADIFVRLIKKVLYIGTFAYILNNFHSLSTIIYSSFTTLGLDASGSGLSADALMQPGKIAGTGFSAAWPLIQQAGTLLGVTSFFTNFLTIVVLFTAWLLVLLAFFILAVQVFITILEFKLTCLAGFTLVPFAFWNRTSFLAERVLGNVVSSGVKVMVLAVIVGIGSTLFSTFANAASDGPATIASAMSLVLAALTFLGLGIFGPAVATGLVAGAPQLGAGAVVGTLGTAVGAGMVVSGLAAAGVGALSSAAGGLGAIRAGASLGGGGGPPTGGHGGSPAPSGGGPGGGGPAGGGSKTTPMAKPSPSGGSSGGSSSGSGGGATAAASPSASADMPAWARQLRSEQRARDVRRGAVEAIKAGDRPGAPANPDLEQEE